MWLFVLTPTVQWSTSISDAVTREILDLVRFYEDNPAQKLAELSAIKEVTPSLVVLVVITMMIMTMIMLIMMMMMLNIVGKNS